MPTALAALSWMVLLWGVPSTGVSRTLSTGGREMVRCEEAGAALLTGWLAALAADWLAVLAAAELAA